MKVIKNTRILGKRGCCRFLSRNFSTSLTRVVKSDSYYNPTKKLPKLVIVPALKGQGVYLLLGDNKKVIVGKILKNGKTLNFLNSDLDGVTPELLGILLPELTWYARFRIIMTKYPEFLSTEICKYETLKEIKQNKDIRIKASLLKKINKIEPTIEPDLKPLDLAISRNAYKMGLNLNALGTYHMQSGRGGFSMEFPTIIFTSPNIRGITT